MSVAGYTTLLELSRQMLEQAKQQAWEPLAMAQEQRATLIARLSLANQAMTPAEQASVAQIIREIQGLDREVMEYVTPWREDVAKLLSRLAPLS
ncbi:MAG: flagellar protein FliT [Azonexaceae bacterium]|nr:flagellar protein FliT [Azonexaceae bacterium]